MEYEAPSDILDPGGLSGTQELFWAYSTAPPPPPLLSGGVDLTNAIRRQSVAMSGEVYERHIMYMVFKYRHVLEMDWREMGTCMSGLIDRVEESGPVK